MNCIALTKKNKQCKGYLKNSKDFLCEYHRIPYSSKQSQDIYNIWFKTKISKILVDHLCNYNIWMLPCKNCDEEMCNKCKKCSYCYQFSCDGKYCEICKECSCQYKNECDKYIQCCNYNIYGECNDGIIYHIDCLNYINYDFFCNKCYLIELKK